MAYIWKSLSTVRSLAAFTVGRRNFSSKLIEKLSLSYYSYDPQYISQYDSIPIFCLHGLYTSKEFFYSLAPILARDLGRPVYLIDLRNHGESPHSDYDGKASTLVHAEDILNVMDELHLRQAMLIGHGFGARVSVQLSQLYPQRVEKIVSIDFSQDGPYLYLNSFARYLHALDDIRIQVDHSLSDVRLVMKKILQSHVRNPFFMKYILYNIRKKADGTFDWKFNTQVLGRMLKNWAQVKQITYHRAVHVPIMNIVTKQNYLSSEDYHDIKIYFKNCEVKHYKSKLVSCNRPSLISIIENFAIK